MTEETLLRLANKENEKLKSEPRHTANSHMSFGALLGLGAVATELGFNDVWSEIHAMLRAHMD